MTRIRIELNGQQVDFYNVKDLPVTLTKQTDDLSGIGRGTGTVAQNGTSRFQLPATKRNIAIVQSAYIPTANNAPSRQKFDLNIYVGGSNTFAGSCLLVDKIISGKYPKTLSFETSGDGLDIWSRLEGLSLRQIPMGSTVFSTANVLASQTGTPSTGWPVIYAPVIYGNTQGANDPSPSYSGAMFTTGDFRPAVYEKHIIKSIFEDYLKVKIVSSFMDTAYFERWVYMFGVGDKWKVATDVAKFRIELSANYTLPSPGGGGFVNVRFNNIIFDPLSGWNGVNYEYNINVTGQWRISGGLNWANIKSWRLIVQDVNPAPNIYEQYGTYYLSSTANPGALSFEILFRAGTKLSLQVEPKNPNYTIIATDSYLQAELIDYVTVNSPLSIQSLLHDKPVKDFLKGVSHKFNLLWFYNPRTRMVYVEPRFDYYLPDAVFFTLTRYQGWYKSPKDADALPMSLDADTIQLPVTDSYGKYLQLGYKWDNDPVGEYYKLGKNESFIPVDGMRIDFTDRGIEGKTEENPYFCNLFLGFSNTVSTFEYALPCILPNGTNMEELFEVDIFGRVIGTLPDATFESEPKCGMVYYNKTFVRHEENLATPINYALVMQSNNLALNRGAMIIEKWSGGYGKSLRFLRGGTANPAATLGEELDGLARYFYWIYFACVAEQMKLIGRFNLKTPKVSSENFRALRKLLINGKESLWILHKIQEFKPASIELTQCELYPYREPTKELIDTIQYNDLQQAPFNHVNFNAL